MFLMMQELFQLTQTAGVGGGAKHKVIWSGLPCLINPIEPDKLRVAISPDGRDPSGLGEPYPYFR